jgi:adenine-specific DNA-methyltransferase
LKQLQDLGLDDLKPLEDSKKDPQDPKAQSGQTEAENGKSQSGEPEAENEKTQSGEPEAENEKTQSGEPETENRKSQSEKPEAANGKSLLMKHLTRFTRRNTSDFFIHKNLRGFLRRELDFFIKSECLLLDELLAQEGNLTHQDILRARAVRDVGHQIIEFLAQVEDFQKRLFEKKKFVIRTEYCITMDRVPEELWDEVLQNKDQLDDWRQLYGVDPQPTRDFLREHPYLVVDTCHFSEDFKWRLLAHFDDLDEALDGLLIKSENFQALNLLMERYRGQVKCVYIDPPYNTETDRSSGRFLYKDGYERSSWLSFIYDRIVQTLPLLADDAPFLVSIDEHEFGRLNELLGQLLGERIGVFTWVKKAKGSHLSQTIRDMTEFVLAYCRVKEGLVLYGEAAYSEKAQPLVKKTNARKTLKFPPNSVRTTLDDGTYEAGERGEGDSALRFIEPFSVVDGVVTTGITVEGPFVWTQAKLDEELALGTIPQLSRQFGFNVVRHDQAEKFKRPSTLLSSEQGIGTNESAFQEYVSLFGIEPRGLYPKPVSLISYLIRARTFFSKDGVVLDAFAGSGTTAHAVINLNREDGGRRKYILVEMGDYFETVLLKRIKKVVYSDSWKDGKPQKGKGISHFFKYLYLEQYEDTLNNLDLTRKEEGQLALERFGDEYLLRYMLEFETQGSPSLLNLEQFQDPFNYKLKVQEGDEIRECVVDLVETFNYLLGIHVKKMRQFQDNGRLYRAVLGEKHGKRIVIVWRSLKGLLCDSTDVQRDQGSSGEPGDAQRDKDSKGDTPALRRDRKFIECIVLPALLGKGKKPDRLLVNGICYVPEAEPIEPEFKRLMCRENQDGWEV